jgi:MFS family permease
MNDRQKSPRSGLPRGIWALGLVSLFMDISSEMIHALLPAFLVGTLGASVAFVGLVEGLGEGLANIVKLFSRRISDRIGRRKPLALLGYGLGTVSKPIFALATGPYWVLTARLSDRFGKGMRGAPRDALVAALAPEGKRGAAFGLRQSLDNVGAFAGPLLALLFLSLFAGDMRAVFWVAAIPGLGPLAVLWLAVPEPSHPKPAPAPQPVWHMPKLPPAFWIVFGFGILVTLARFSEAFVILRAQDLGLSLLHLPLVLVVMNAGAAFSAYPAGVISDRIGRHGLLLAGIGVLVVADVFLALAGSPSMALVASGIWGLHLGMMSGLLAAEIAATVPDEIRGTAFGVFNFGTGVALILASSVAGLVWEWIGPAATFWLGGGLSLGALALGLAWRPKGAGAGR